MTPQELKSSILQMAMQGKLVEQREEEGTAEELYQKIQEEKKKLIRGGVIKKEKELPEITEEEKPFEIPEGWKWVRLGDIASVLGGKRIPAGRTLTTENTGHKYIRVSDMKNESVLMDNVLYVPKDIYPSISKYIIRNEDIYITVAGTIGRVGKIPLELDGANLTENADRLVFSRIDQEWFIKCLQSQLVQLQITEATTKVGQPKLAIRRIQELILPLPPLEEQKRIVVKIEELLPYIDRYEKAWSKLEEFNKRFPIDMQKSILQMAIQGKLVEQRPEEGTGEELYQKIQEEKKKLIKDGVIKKEKPLPEITEEEIPFEIPEGWKWCTLNQLIVKMGAGSTPTGGKAVYVENGIKFIRSQNVYNDGLRLNNVAYITEKINAKKVGSIVYPKDILLNITGGSIGRCAVVSEDFDCANVNQHVMIIRMVDEHIRHWIHTVLISPYIQDLIMEVQVGVSREGLSVEKAKQFLIPLPPFSEQKRIIEKLKKILPLCKKLE